MLKIKDFDGSFNSQSSVMYNVMIHVPSHRFFNLFGFNYFDSTGVSAATAATGIGKIFAAGIGRIKTSVLILTS